MFMETNDTLLVSSIMYELSLSIMYGKIYFLYKEEKVELGIISMLYTFL